MFRTVEVRAKLEVSDATEGQETQKKETDVEQQER